MNQLPQEVGLMGTRSAVWWSRCCSGLWPGSLRSLYSWTSAGHSSPPALHPALHPLTTPLPLQCVWGFYSPTFFLEGCPWATGAALSTYTESEAPGVCIPLLTPSPQPVAKDQRVPGLARLPWARINPTLGTIRTSELPCRIREGRSLTWSGPFFAPSPFLCCFPAPPFLVFHWGASLINPMLMLPHPRVGSASGAPKIRTLTWIPEDISTCSLLIPNHLVLSFNVHK